MSRSPNLPRAAALIAAVFVFLSVGQVMAADNLPDKTDDGLVRIPAKKVQALYWRPSASLEPYKRVAILEPFVAFRKDWQREQNRDRPGARQVTSGDMERIKRVLADEFQQVFTKELQEGGYDVVDAAAEDVLLLRPAIVNLDVNAPDLQTPERRSAFVASAGSMTLYMELYDSATSALIGRVIDARAAPDDGFFQVSSSVTNRAEADRILGRWAALLGDALDERWNPKE